MGRFSPEYVAYIGSQAWADRKARYYRTHRKRCRVCRSTRGVQLHHRSYRRLGRERDRDFVPLCERHHSRLTDFGHRHCMRVETATRYYLVAAVTWRVLPLVAVPVISYFAVLGLLGTIR